MGYQGRVLIVEDDVAQRRLYMGLARSGGWDVDAVEDGESALRRLEEDPVPDVMLLDLVLPGIDGLTVLSRLRADGVAVPVVMMTADGSINRAIDAMRLGASDFLVKPVAQDRLLQTISDWATQAPQHTPESAAVRDEVSGIVAGAPAMQAALRTALKAARARIPVLLLGESGTGKEVMARTIHEKSARTAGPFVPVNCGAIPENLVESLLFGHERGAFTGADKAMPGLIRSADGGTLFLDEVGELPLLAQAKVLRFLQESVVDPVGGRPISVDTRIVSATNRDLREEIQGGRFREDLYFRLAGIEISLPPLRERPADIAALANLHALELADAEGLAFDGFTPAAEAWLASQDWPGNVRELQNAVYRAMVMADEPLIDSRAFGADQIPVADTAPAPAAGGEVRTLRDLEIEAIRHALSVNNGAIARSARELGIGRSTLYRKLEEYGLMPNPEPDQP